MCLCAPRNWLWKSIRVYNHRLKQGNSCTDLAGASLPVKCRFFMLSLKNIVLGWRKWQVVGKQEYTCHWGTRLCAINTCPQPQLALRSFCFDKVVSGSSGTSVGILQICLWIHWKKVFLSVSQHRWRRALELGMQQCEQKLHLGFVWELLPWWNNSINNEPCRTEILALSPGHSSLTAWDHVIWLV